MSDKIISITILTKNAGSLFCDVLHGIFNQRVDFDYEVVVVDSGSEDSTLELISRYPIRLYTISPSEFRFGPTREYAFSLCKGDYLVTLSQDVVPANDQWLQALIEPLRAERADVSQGLTILPEDRRSFFWDRKGMFYFTQESRKFARDHGKIGLSCCAIAMTRRAWEDTGFGDASMSEDKEIQRRLFQKGYRMEFAEESLAYHGHDYDLNTLAKRCENEGLGWRSLGVVYTFRELIRDLFQPKWVYGILVRGILSRELQTPAELFFLLVRPLAVFKGNRFNIGYRH